MSEGNDFEPIQQSYEIRQLRQENQALRERLRDVPLNDLSDDTAHEREPNEDAERRHTVSRQVRLARRKARGSSSIKTRTFVEVSKRLHHLVQMVFAVLSRLLDIASAFKLSTTLRWPTAECRRALTSAGWLSVSNALNWRQYHSGFDQIVTHQGRSPGGSRDLPQLVPSVPGPTAT